MIFFFCQNNELYQWIVYPYTYTSLFMNFGKMACINKISLNINFPLFCFRIVQKLKGGGFILNYIFRSDFKWYRWFLKQKWRGKPPSPLLWLHICTCINNLRQTPFFYNHVNSDILLLQIRKSRENFCLIQFFIQMQKCSKLNAKKLQFYNHFYSLPILTPICRIKFNKHVLYK